MGPRLSQQGSCQGLKVGAIWACQPGHPPCQGWQSVSSRLIGDGYPEHRIESKATVLWLISNVCHWLQLGCGGLNASDLLFLGYRTSTENSQG